MRCSGAAMIEVRNLTKRYGDLVAVDRGHLHRGKGRDRSASSVPTARARRRRCASSPASCRPPAGTVKVAGFDIFDDAYEVRKRIGYLPENPPLYADMTVTSLSASSSAASKASPRADLPRRVDRVRASAAASPR